MTNGVRNINFDIVITHHEGEQFPNCKCDTCYEKAYYENGCNSYKMFEKSKKKSWYNYIKILFCN
jgi:hypothetical protein